MNSIHKPVDSSNCSPSILLPLSSCEICFNDVGSGEEDVELLRMERFDTFKLGPLTVLLRKLILVVVVLVVVYKMGVLGLLKTDNHEKSQL